MRELPLSMTRFEKSRNGQIRPKKSKLLNSISSRARSSMSRFRVEESPFS